ncbi:peptide-methionine (S)-S-oxide reductase MsrA [Legionella sp. W05-934-2]|jgi:peptide-methionine (S)-S-oxide reductase|uniref:peptide-methionine (S)-S-oxide reductase MsrA n=1 Tax=Legionella sp. W05-934-2 TaxID=1198649 RepID=UPI0034623089
MLRVVLFVFGCLISISTYSETAIFAGGCFWCVEADFDKLPGVTKTISGFDGGKVKSPTYQLVSSGKTKYVESVQITYDPNKISYQKLVEYYLMHIDPTDSGGQFCDRGRQYRPVIFYQNDQEKDIAYSVLLEAKRVLEREKVVVELSPSTTFYPAEQYHQNYHVNHSVKYNYYRWRCGRDQRVKEVWDGKSL